MVGAEYAASLLSGEVSSKSTIQEGLYLDQTLSEEQLAFTLSPCIVIFVVLSSTGHTWIITSCTCEKKGILTGALNVYCMRGVHIDVHFVQTSGKAVITATRSWLPRL
jgi:hypothetical protein